MNSKNRLIFVSGATGYLASHIIKQLLEKDYLVRGSVRSLSNPKNSFLYNLVPSKSQNLSLVESNLLDSNSWIPALKDCDYVIHVASPIPPYIPTDENELIIPSVEGTKNVFEAALLNKCKKFVMTSSTLCVVIGNENKICTEEDWSILDKSAHYSKSKILSEKKAWEIYELNKKQIEFTVINPSFIIGPLFTQHGNSSETLISNILDGSFPGIPSPDIGYRVVDVRDAAEAHINALFLENTNGKRYIVSHGEVLLFSKIIEILKNEFEKKGCKINETIVNKEEILQSKNQIAIRTAANIGKTFNISNEKSIKELNLIYRHWEESLIEMGDSILKNKIKI